jgi:elongation factor Ts
MAITAAQIKELREATGAGVLDCRKALEESQGDMQQAAEFLRDRGLAAAAKRSERETRNGLVELYNHGEGRVGVMVEVNCETDFVARTQEFRSFAHEISLQVAAGDPLYVDVTDIPEAVIEEQKHAARRMASEEGKPEAVIDRIVEGRLEKFYQEACLLRQPYVRDDSRTIAELLQEMTANTGEKIVIRRFARWAVGEDIG